MVSISTLEIRWLRPEIEDERWEYFHHPEKQHFYAAHGINWELMREGWGRGRLEPYPRGGIFSGMAVEGAYPTYDDYLTYLAKAKRGYRRNYSRMEEELQQAGGLLLPAPIVLSSGTEALLFSGWRRLCLAWNYGMIPHVWHIRV